MLMPEVRPKCAEGSASQRCLALVGVDNRHEDLAQETGTRAPDGAILALDNCNLHYVYSVQ